MDKYLPHVGCPLAYMPNDLLLLFIKDLSCLLVMGNKYFWWVSKRGCSLSFKVPICDLWENGKIYDIDSCRDYISGLKH
jgi:hypothetical protein